MKIVIDIMAIILSAIISFGGGYLFRYSQEINNIEKEE